MTVKSKLFGEVKIDEDEIFTFPSGILGFPDKKRFVFLKTSNYKPLGNVEIEFFHSVEDDDLVFATCDPQSIAPDFSIIASEDEVSDIELKNPEDAIVRVVLTLSKNPENITANLLAPLVINARNKLGKQMVLEGAEELVSYKVAEGIEKLKNIQGHQFPNFKLSP